jgi:hypothetical protein
VVQTDAEILSIIEDAIRKYAPDTEVIHNDRDAYRCEDFDAPESILVKTDANQSKPHDFLCAKCFLDRLQLGLNARHDICPQSEQR